MDNNEIMFEEIELEGLEESPTVGEIDTYKLSGLKCAGSGSTGVACGGACKGFGCA
ncbi:MAG: hypothetical protein PHG16_05340 [Lachnospiraceae bacterium]|nr:hypothetical protein [Lachnospiraceae bacterium]